MSGLIAGVRLTAVANKQKLKEVLRADISVLYDPEPALLLLLGSAALITQD